MHFSLLVLDGPQKNSVLSLYDGRNVNSKACVFIDSAFHWNIKALDEYKVRIGSVEKDQAKLVPGLIFHLGQIGFRVIETPALEFKNWQEALIDFLESDSWPKKEAAGFCFFHSPLRLKFVEGPQADEFLTLSYGPRELGFNNLDLNIIDPTQPRKIARFYQKDHRLFIENISGGNTLINSNAFTDHAISNGDLLSFGLNIIELMILK